MSRHLSTRNVSSKSMHAFLSNLANRQTDKRTRAKTFTSSFVGGNKWFCIAACPYYCGCLLYKVQKMRRRSRRSFSSAKSYLFDWRTSWRNSVYCQNRCYEQHLLNKSNSGKLCEILHCYHDTCSWYEVRLPPPADKNPIGRNPTPLPLFAA